MSMDAQLVALAGPLQGSVLPLREDEISIGRDAANVLRLEDRAVSRRHCVIVRENGQYRIRDMQSANRTRVNGLPVEEQELANRDEIRIGRSVFLFLAEADESLSSRQEVAWDEGASGVTFILKREGALYLHPQE